MLHFEHGERSINMTFVEPTAVARKIEAGLTEQLSHLTWPGYLHQMAITDLQVAELPPPEQWGLFDEGALAPSALTTPEPAEWLAGLRQRYGAIRYQGQLQDPTHPVAHHRTTLTPL